LEVVSDTRISATYQESLRQGLIDAEDTSIIFIDLDILDDRLSRVQRSFPRDALHAVAVKTNPLLFILRHIANFGLGLEAASYGEIELALAAGVSQDKIVFDSPAKTLQELAHLEKYHPNVRVNANSFDELERLGNKSSLLNLGLRVNPNIVTSKIESLDVSQPDSKFGVTVEAILARADVCLAHEQLNCLHVHTGSQCFDYSRMVAAVRKTIDLAQELNHRAGYKKIIAIDIGGGFPVDYGRQNECMIEDYSRSLKEECPEIWNGTYELITEFGRFVHANAGWSASKVEYVQHHGETDTLITHLGADMFLRECYSSTDWDRHYNLLDSAGGLVERKFVKTNLTGPLCFAGDIYGRHKILSKANPGDVVIAKDIGANTFSLWSRHCSRLFPKVIAYNFEGDTCVPVIAKSRESYRQIVKFWS
jgi:diaminopimelate decarboxylase